MSVYKTPLNEVRKNTDESVSCVFSNFSTIPNLVKQKLINQFSGILEPFGTNPKLWIVGYELNIQVFGTVLSFWKESIIF